MKLSSRVFLVSADDMLHALASAAFMRMLRQEEPRRLPDFAGQRVRQVSTVVELVDGTPTRTVYRTFSVLDFDAAGLLDVVRLNNQQIARMEAGVWGSRAGNRSDRPIVDAVDRFVARGGTWRPNEHLLRTIEAAALGQLPCPRVQVVG